MSPRPALRSGPLTTRGAVLVVLAVAALSALLLAPVSCVSACELRGAGAGDGGCVTSCDTLLGWPSPAPSGTWLVPPLLLAVVLAHRVSTRHGRR